MNREIKFRAWANTDNGMKVVYFAQISCDNGLWFAANEHIDDYENSIMQFTGLSDKNVERLQCGD